MYDQQLKAFISSLDQWKLAHSWNVQESDFDPADSYMAHEGIHWSHSPWVADPHSRNVYLGQPGIHHLDLLRHHGLVDSSYNTEDIPVPWGMINHGMVYQGEGEHEIAQAIGDHTGLPVEEPEPNWDFESKVAGGQNYKGLVLNDGTVHAWPIDNMNGSPYHEAYMRSNRLYPDQVRSYHDITNGKHWSDRQDDKQAVQEALGLNMQEPSWAL